MKFAAIIGMIVIGILVVALGALIGGTLVWIIWPHVIPVVFPGLVASGAIAGTLLWWKAVLFTWLAGLLFKSSSASTSNK